MSDIAARIRELRVELDQVKARVIEHNTKITLAQEEMDKLLAQLRDEFKCDSVADAKVKIAAVEDKLEEKIVELEAWET